MKRIFFIIALSIIPLRILIGGDGIRIRESISFFSKILNQDVKYSICLPPDYFSGKKVYPVVYLLHGLGDNESSWLEYGMISQTSDQMIKNKAIIPLIFVMPEGFRNYYVNDYAETFLYQDMFVKELVPMIDSLYKTIPNNLHRATLGYSMGGFGALNLALKHPEVFTVAVPLSISVRTDSQYMVEDAAEWDLQWGRLFGGVGKTGQDRITDYYKFNSPFYIFENTDLEELKNLKIFIDNGDDENTLCRSNEKLHILMREKSIPHEYRVRNGGHEFEYWRESLPTALCFISDAFEGKTYRGDQISSNPPKIEKQLNLIDSGEVSFLLPEEYSSTDRYYPIVFIVGSFSSEEKATIGKKVASWINNGYLSPVILAYINEAPDISEIGKFFSNLESQYRIRSGYRFRAIIACGEEGNKALNLCLDSLVFTFCGILDGKPDNKRIASVLNENGKIVKSKTLYYIDSPDKGLNFAENGKLHILLRDEDFYHEYRVREGFGGFNWFLSGLFETLVYTQNKIHK